MPRFVLATLLASATFGAHASPDACRVHGIAYDYAGRPLPSAVVRLIDPQSRRTNYQATDAHGSFAFDIAGGADRGFRLDVLSGETVVVGTHIRTRSILGLAAPFHCTAGEAVRVDVRVQVP